MSPMQKNHFILSASSLAIVLCSLLNLGQRKSEGSEPPRITSATVADGKLDISWQGPSSSYQVQSATNLAQPVWRNVLSAVRTNVSIPILDNASFFRIVDPDPNFLTLTIAMTNVLTRDGVVLTLEKPPRLDLVFDAETDSASSDPVRVVFPSEGLKLYDIAFDGKGGFSFTTNGVPTVYGGTWKTEAGPGPNDLTHSGIFTNLTDVFEFRAVTDPAPDNDVGAGLLGGMTWIYCLPGFAAKNLQCQAAASALFLTCAFQFKLPYATFTSKIDASGLMTNHIECITTCLTGCK